MDPNRDIHQYLRAAQAMGLRVAHVTETHIHADFVSGSRELAARAGAALVLAAAAAAPLPAQAGPTDSSALLAFPGISEALARHRAATIRAVRYDLRLDVTARDSATGRP